VSDAPPFLRPPEIGASWKDARTASAYRYRPQYPPETYEIVAGLIVDEPRTVLDLGCGTGYVARPLAPLVDRVDAVDISPEMIEEAKRQPGGDASNITWIVGRAEDVALKPPYALVTAGDSLHWFDWTVVMPRLVDVLAPRGRFALLDVDGDVVGATDSFREQREALLDRYATYSMPRVPLIRELERAGVFREEGRRETAPIRFRQSVEEYVESYHAHSLHAWSRMSPEDAATFDDALRALVRDHIGDTVEMDVHGLVVWGKPLRPGK
jgi:SAM-dependent methyltransferase